MAKTLKCVDKRVHLVVNYVSVVLAYSHWSLNEVAQIRQHITNQRFDLSFVQNITIEGGYIFAALNSQ